MIKLISYYGTLKKYININSFYRISAWVFNDFVAIFMPVLRIWRNDDTFGYVNVMFFFYNWHINLTEYKHMLFAKNEVFANFVWKSERCRRTLAYIFQTNNIILINFWHVLHNEMRNHLLFTDLKYLEIWSFYIISKFEQCFGLFETFRTSNPESGFVSDFRLVRNLHFLKL